MRVRFTAPRGAPLQVRYLDSLHAALVNAWTAASVPSAAIVGREASNWSFGAVGRAMSRTSIVKSVVVGAEDERLEPILRHLNPEAIQKKSINGDTVDLSGWSRSIEELPVAGELGEPATLGAIMLSPLALSVRGQEGRWHDDLTRTGADLEEGINFRLSRLVGRDVRLTVEPDRLYLRANPRHSTLVRTRMVRKTGKAAFVIGMMCPLLIRGSIEDLKSAWALGIGEKNRYGFGCIGSATSAGAMP